MRSTDSNTVTILGLTPLFRSKLEEIYPTKHDALMLLSGSSVDISLRVNGEQLLKIYRLLLELKNLGAELVFSTPTYKEFGQPFIDNKSGRVVYQDGQSFMITADMKFDRPNYYIVNDRIIRTEYY